MYATTSRRAEIERPVCTPYHAGSVFGPGRSRAFTIGDRALFLARLHAVRVARKITAAHAEVGRALLHRLGPDGRLDPSYACLAADTGLDPRTIGRAIRALANALLLSWQRRLVRSGWAVRQTSNAYELVPQGQPLPPPPLKTRGIGSIAIESFAGDALASRDRQLAILAQWTREAALRQAGQGGIEDDRQGSASTREQRGGPAGPGL